MTPLGGSDTPDWMADAACRGSDSELFFPTRGDSARELAAARAVCAGCVVADDCLEYALVNRELYGVWGGLSERERRRIRRVRLRAGTLTHRPTCSCRVCCERRSA